MLLPVQITRAFTRKEARDQALSIVVHWNYGREAHPCRLQVYYSSCQKHIPRHLVKSMVKNMAESMVVLPSGIVFLSLKLGLWWGFDFYSSGHWLGLLQSAIWLDLGWENTEGVDRSRRQLHWAFFDKVWEEKREFMDSLFVLCPLSLFVL